MMLIIYVCIVSILRARGGSSTRAITRVAWSWYSPRTRR